MADDEDGGSKINEGTRYIKDDPIVHLVCSDFRESARWLHRATTHAGGIEPVDDVKNLYREGEQTTKEAWRQADGDDSLANKVGNAGDEIRKDLGNAGDDVNNAAKQSGAKEAARAADGDDSLADKVGNAGDDLRRDMGENS